MPEADWEICVVRELQWVAGTTFYEVHGDGTVDVYFSIGIDSMRAFLERLDPDLSLRKQITLTPEQFSEFLGLLDAIRENGRLIPPPEPDESKRIWRTDGIELGIRLDGEDLGPWNLAEYEDYPPEAYKAVWSWLRTLTWQD